MRLPRVVEIIVLIAAVLFSFYWYNQTYLSKFSLQLLALLILIFIFHNWWTRNRHSDEPIQKYQSITNIIIITVITIILVLTTGGAGSMLFFLLDFLLFFVAVFCYSWSSFCLALAIDLGCLLNEPILNNQELINLFSLLFMAPLAMFFSTQYSRLITARKEIKALSNQTNSLENSTLIWLSLDFRDKLEQAVDLVSQISSNLNNIPYHQKEKLNQLYQDLKALFKSGQELGRKIKDITVVVLIIAFAAITTPKISLAVDQMDSNSFKIRWPNLNMTSGTPSSTNYNILNTVGQTAPGEYDSAGFKVRAGFPYIKTIIPFSFTIAGLSIDFGTLTPNAFPSPLPTTTLTISSGGADGYSVTAFEDYPLKLINASATIPDTTCNSGTCSEVTSGVWDDTSKYGFGYNMSGNDVDTSAGNFVGSSYFKQFADASLSETAQPVMSSVNVGQGRTATVNYKVNVAATQTAGNYENAITFIATPGY